MYDNGHVIATSPTAGGSTVDLYETLRWYCNGCGFGTLKNFAISENPRVHAQQHATACTFNPRGR